MTNYGTIPTSTPAGGGGAASGSTNFISRAKERMRSNLEQRKPWKEMFNIHSFNLPSSFNDAIGRIKKNIAYFRMNYAIVVLIILFLSLLWHPISLIVFAVMMAGWVFLYFLRDEELVIMGRTISDKVVLIVLWVVTIGGLLLTHATLNVGVSILVGVVLVLVHSAVRRSDDLYDDDEGGDGQRPLYSSS